MDYCKHLWSDMRPLDYHPEVIKAIHYMSDNYIEIKSIPEVASAINVNYHTLRDRFSRETRITLEGFLIRTRLNAALGKLADKSRLIKQIAWDVGYEYEDQLTRAFRKYLNTTPQMIRVQSDFSQGISKALNKIKS